MFEQQLNSSGGLQDGTWWLIRNRTRRSEENSFARSHPPYGCRWLPGSPRSHGAWLVRHVVTQTCGNADGLYQMVFGYLFGEVVSAASFGLFKLWNLFSSRLGSFGRIRRAQFVRWDNCLTLKLFFHSFCFSSGREHSDHEKSTKCARVKG